MEDHHRADTPFGGPARHLENRVLVGVIVARRGLVQQQVAAGEILLRVREMDLREHARQLDPLPLASGKRGVNALREMLGLGHCQTRPGYLEVGLGAAGAGMRQAAEKDHLQSLEGKRKLLVLRQYRTPSGKRARCPRGQRIVLHGDAARVGRQ